MTDKFSIGIAVAFLAVFILGIGTVVGINTMSERTTVSTQLAATNPDAPSLPASANPVPAPEIQTPAPVVSPSTVTATTPPSSSQATQVTVLKSDLDKLAAAVKLGGTGGDVGKEIWAQQVSVAEKLLQGLCDCDQRNWLKHFVKAGNEALSGSPDYYQSVQTLATLRRSNQDLTANQASGSH